MRTVTPCTGRSVCVRSGESQMFSAMKSEHAVTMKPPAKRGHKPAASRGNKGYSRGATARVSSSASRNTLARTKTLLSAALRVWELKRRLSAE